MKGFVRGDLAHVECLIRTIVFDPPAGVVYLRVLRSKDG